MADIQKTVEIIFGAVDNTGSGLSSVTSSLDSAINDVSNITEPLSKVADFALKAETAVLALGATFLTIAVNEASKFGEKVEEIGSLVNATPAEFEALKGSIQDFAAKSVSGFDEINKAMYIAVSNLGSTAKAMDVLTVAEKGAQVGATDIETATALLTRTMNAYGLVTNDSATNTANAERVMAAMFTTVQNGDINMQGLSDNLGKVASTASAAGVPIEVVGAAIAALTGAGVNADQSMTLLNSLFKELLNPSDDLAKALNGLSITTDGLPAVLDALKNSTGGSAEKLFELFNSSEAAKGAMILANDSAGKFDNTLKAMDGNVQVFNTNYKNMVGGVADSNQQLINQATILLQKVGEPLQDGWAGILDSLSKMMSGFSVSIEAGAFDPVFTAFDAFGGDIAALLKKIGENLPEALGQVDFAGLIASFKDLGFELGDIFVGVDLTTPRGLADAIQFVVDSFESLTRVVSGIVDVWGPVVRGFFDGIDVFNDLDDSTKKTIGQVTGLAQVFEALKGVLDGSTSLLDGVGKAMSDIANLPGVQAVGTVAAVIVGAASAAVLAIVALAVREIGVIAAASPLAAVIVADLAAGAFAIKENVDAWQEYKDRQDTVASSTANLADSQSKIKDKLQEISNATGVTITSVADLNKAMDNNLITMDKTTGAYSLTAAGVKEYGVKVDDATKSSSWFADAVNDISKNIVGINPAVDNVIGTFKTLAEAEQFFTENMSGAGNATIEFVDGLYTIKAGSEEAAKSTDELAKATKEAAKAGQQGSEEWKRVQDVLLNTQKQADDFTIKLGELAAKKYEIDVKANVDLKIAEIEADTQRITAAFQATSESITALTTSTTDLWSTFSGANYWDKSDIKEAAFRMENRLDEELAIKREMTDALVEKLHAESIRLESGEPLISIDARELAPELELVFDKILKYTQVKATQQGLSLLVGL